MALPAASLDDNPFVGALRKFLVDRLAALADMTPDSTFGRVLLAVGVIGFLVAITRLVAHRRSSATDNTRYSIDAARIERIVRGAEDPTGVAAADSGSPARRLPIDDKIFASRMIAGMVDQIQRERAIEAARGREEVVARLTLQVPIRAKESAASWFGGAPALPEGMAWPTIEGRCAAFLAQIDCAALPAGLWDGAGPREGWLVFFAHPETCVARVLHIGVREQLRSISTDEEYALAPEAFFAPAGGLRFRRDLPHAPRRRFPRWPVDIVAVRRGESDPRREGRSRIADGNYQKGYDLSEPEHQPFDWPSTLAMLDILESRFSGGGSPSMAERHAKRSAELARLRALVAERAELSPPPGDIDKLHARILALEAWERQADVAARVAARLREISARTREIAEQTLFSPGAIAPLLRELHAIEWLHVAVENSDSPPRTMQLPITDVRYLQGPYASCIEFPALRYDWAKHAYACAPESLPPAARAYFVRLWADESAHQMASMGHAPFGYLDSFDLEEDVVLIELPSSGLMSWMFGDVNSLVITMKRADLATGRWDSIKAQVTN